MTLGQESVTTNEGASIVSITTNQTTAAPDGAPTRLVSGINHVAILTEDPDGMRGEVCWIVEPSLRGFHAPRPLAQAH